MSVLDAENVNYLWAGLLFEEWKRQGLKHVIVCPGSRSSPLAIAAARTEGLEVSVVADERCAGFIALGSAKARGVPVVVVTTSGTAVANLLPATVEASMSGVPMLLVTADRPPELRECGANQAIPQSDIFGRFVRWSFELGCPTPDVDPAYVLSTAAETWARATSGPSGAVHLNCSFREPLAPLQAPLGNSLERIAKWSKDSKPWRVEVRRGRDESGIPLGEWRGRRILVAVGERWKPNALSAEIGLGPRLADVTSGPRRGLDLGMADLILAAAADARCAPLRERLRPDVVFRFGGAISSKRVNALIAECPNVFTNRRAGMRFDESHSANGVASPDWQHSPREVFEHNREYIKLWESVSHRADAVVDAELNQAKALTEPYIARTLPRRMREGHLVIGSSMPIRDVNTFWPNDARALRVIANRGASGIDGTVSTAVGVAMSSSVPTTLLLGDLALLHDLGGLANIRLAHQPLHIVVINNDGGGIFHFLPIAEHAASAPHFEKLFGTPHGFSFEHAAKMFGLEYRRAATKQEAASAFAELATLDKPVLIECITDRATNVEAHRSIQRAVADALAREFA